MTTYIATGRFWWPRCADSEEKELEAVENRQAAELGRWCSFLLFDFDFCFVLADTHTTYTYPYWLFGGEGF